jgi:prephenate dehydrogenase
MEKREHIAIMGMGLMGASLGAALKKSGYQGKVIGYARNEVTAQQGVSKGWFDEASSSVNDVVAEADLVVMSLPVRTIEPFFTLMQPHLKADAIVTDVGSTKHEIESAINPLICDTSHYFVGSHPICGSEKSGLDAAHEKLYEGHTCIICPTIDTPPEVLAKVRRLWALVGMQIAEMPSKEHDDLLAATSHLPHLVATALVRAVLNREQSHLHSFCGSGFEDTTRVAAGSASLWTDIVLSNSTSIVNELKHMQQELAAMSSLLERSDQQGLYDWLQSGAALRRALKDTREDA